MPKLKPTMKDRMNSSFRASIAYHGITQTEISNRTGYHRNTVSNHVRNPEKMNIQEYREYIRVCSMENDEILFFLTGRRA